MKEPDGYRKYICISLLHEDIIIRTKNIIYIQAHNTQCAIYTASGTSPVISSKPFGHYLKILKSSGFLQVHKSYLINLRHVIKKTKYKSPGVILTKDICIPVSQSYKSALDQYFEKLK